MHARRQLPIDNAREAILTANHRLLLTDAEPLARIYFVKVNPDNDNTSSIIKLYAANQLM